MKKEYLIGLGLLAVIAYLYYSKKTKDEVDTTSLEEETDVDTTSSVPTTSSTAESTGQVVDLAELDGAIMGR